MRWDEPSFLGGCYISNYVHYCNDCSVALFLMGNNRHSFIREYYTMQTTWPRVHMTVVIGNT